MFPKTLRREILLLLGVKAAALALIYLMFFSAGTKPEPGGEQMQTHLLGVQSR